MKRSHINNRFSKRPRNSHIDMEEHVIDRQIHPTDVRSYSYHTEPEPEVQHIRRQRQRLDELQHQIQHQEAMLLTLQRQSDQAFINIMSCTRSNSENRELYWEWIRRSS